jgi:hypothetical protein
MSGAPTTAVRQAITLPVWMTLHVADAMALPLDVAACFDTLLAGDRTHQVGPRPERRALVRGNSDQLPGPRAAESTNLPRLDRANLEGAESGEGDGTAIFQGFDDAVQNGIEGFIPLDVGALELGRDAGGDIAFAECLGHCLPLPRVDGGVVLPRSLAGGRDGRQSGIKREGKPTQGVGTWDQC